MEEIKDRNVRKAIIYLQKDLEKAKALNLQLVNTDRISVETVLEELNTRNKKIHKLQKNFQLVIEDIANRIKVYEYHNKITAGTNFETEIKVEELENEDLVIHDDRDSEDVIIAKYEQIAVLDFCEELLQEGDDK